MSCLVWDQAWQNHRFLFFAVKMVQQSHTWACAAVCCVSTPSWNNLPARWDSITLYQHCSHILRGTIPCKMGRKSITVHHMACQVTRPNTTWFFSCGDLLRTRSSGYHYVIWQTYKNEFMLLWIVLKYRCFITYGSRLNTGWTFPMLLMEVYEVYET